MYSYCAFQLSIQSEMMFPELLPSQIFSEPQVSITFGAVSPQGLGLSALQEGYHQATARELWLNVPHVARFLITHGTHITVDPVAGIDEDSLRVFLLGSCMGALLQQRYLFLLHGNAIKIGDHCISFVGPSGAGKSTLAAAFLRRGYLILADDICALTEKGHILPSFPQLKLWFDAATKLGIETKMLRKIRPDIEKFALPLESHFYQSTLPLKVIYSLHTHCQKEWTVENIVGFQKVQILQNNTYRKAYLQGVAPERYFSQCTHLANSIDVVRVTRPHEGFQLDELVDVIEDDWQARGLFCGNASSMDANPYPSIVNEVI